jgi:DNA polymerase I-like protein with 3'-5' exonuclease and polymerase domains
LADLPSWEGARRVAFDIETCDPDLTKTGPGVRRKGRVVGFSFAIEWPDSKNLANAPCFYVPIDHEGGDNVDAKAALEYLRQQAQVFKGDMVTANGSYDYDYMAQLGIVFRAVRFFRDIQIAEPLLDENQMKYSLDAVLTRNGFEGKNESHLVQAAAMFGINAKSEMWKLPARHVGPYAEADASRLLPLIQKQERRIQAVDDADDRGARLWDLYDLESRLMPVLIKMRRRGVRVDFDHLDIVEGKTFQEEKASLAEVTRLSGVTVTTADINRPTVVAKAIEAATGCKLPLTPKSGKPSIKKEVLEALGDHPVVNHFLRARRFNKLRTTFIESIRTHAIGDRIHCTFHQLRRQKEDGGSAGTITGRLSSGDPTLQQQPARDPEIGKLWRAIYLPDEGAEWACLDYSQQEPRWLVHFAELSNCIGAHEAAERYRSDPSTDNHNMMTQLIHGDDAWNSWDKSERKKHRDAAKIIYLGLCYAMGGAKLCRSLGLPTKWITLRGRDLEVAGEEGQKLLTLFKERVPFLSELARRAENRAKARGFIKTVLGRHGRFPLKKDGSGSYDWTHLALNKLIQGSSADQMKKAMVDADDAGIRLQLQVHDELDLSFWHQHEIDHLAEIMVNAVPCNVPHKVDKETGPNWGEIS